MGKFIFAIFAVAFLTVNATGQVVIAPPIVFISSQVPFGTFNVSNVSTIPQEVDISFEFGYPRSDSLARISIDFSDSVAAGKYSCASWLSGFPTKFILNPGQEQVVHMSVDAPDSLADGAYWSRLITVSQPQQKFVDTVKQGITTNIIFMFRQITSVIFEKGSLETGLNLANLYSSEDSASMNVYAELERTGNAPFFGTASVKVSDQDGNEVYSNAALTAVYLNLVKEFSIPLSKLHKGKYSAVVTVTSDREDIPPEQQLKIAPISRTLSFNVK